MNPPVFCMRGVSKVHRLGEAQVRALDRVDLDLHAGEFVVLLGASGSGVKAPTGAELTALASRIASRVGRFLERQGLLERDAENPCLAELALDDEPMEALLANSITYRIAVGPRAERKVFTL